MQFNKINSNVKEKIIALTLTSLMLISCVGSAVTSAEENQSENVVINENINKKDGSDEEKSEALILSSEKDNTIENTINEEKSGKAVQNSSATLENTSEQVVSEGEKDSDESNVTESSKGVTDSTSTEVQKIDTESETTEDSKLSTESSTNEETKDSIDQSATDNGSIKQNEEVKPEVKPEDNSKSIAVTPKVADNIKAAGKTGVYQEDGKWYKYENGKKTRGWYTVDGKKYYFLNTLNRAENMWRKIGDHLYYFNKDGVMISNQKLTIDGKEYQFNKDGQLVVTVKSGMIQENGKWYKYENGKKIKGWYTVDGKTYYFLNTLNRAENTWRKIGSQIYYFGKDGVMVKNTKIVINGSEYQFNKKGFLEKGVVKESGKWYRYEKGKKTRGWYTEGSKKYYFLNSLNRAEKMWRKIGGKLYYFDADGSMVANRIRYIDGATFKFNSDGSLVSNAKTSYLKKGASIFSSANSGSTVKGKLASGAGIEIIKTSGNFAYVRNGDGTVEGWIQMDSYVSTAEKKLSNVISIAKSKLGSRYVWGATGPNTFDCSGLMLYAFKHGAGYTLPRVSRYQATVGRSVSRADLKPGDLIFWGSPVHHVGMYVGNGKYIHAPQPGTTVTIASLGSYTLARRIIE